MAFQAKGKGNEIQPIFDTDPHGNILLSVTSIVASEHGGIGNGSQTRQSMIVMDEPE